MKKSVSILFFTALISLMFAACGEPADPQEYNNKLIAIQSSVIKPLLEVNNLLSTNDKAKIDSAYVIVVKASNDAVEAIKKEGPFDNDDAFRQKLQNLLEYYQKILKTDYKEMIDIVTKFSEITPEEKSRLEVLYSSISENETKLDAEFQAAQKAFAEKHKLTIQANELQKEIDKQGQ